MNKELEEEFDTLYSAISEAYPCASSESFREDYDRANNALQTIQDYTNNSTSNYVLYDLAREMRQDGSQYWANRLSERINKGGIQ